MTYTKPKNISYVKMCMYFDEHIYDSPETRDDTTLYHYLYYISYMLACKKHYFRNYEDYDGFAVFSATKIYMRIINNAKNPNSKMKHIKSILNYMKSILYPLKVDYQKEHFNQVITPNPEKGITTDRITSSIKDSIQSDYMAGLENAILTDIHYLPHNIARAVDDTPYMDQPVMRYRLYMSCLLSFLSSVTLSNPNREKLRRYDLRSKDTDERDGFLSEMYQNEKAHSLILWRLPPEMGRLVEVLTNRVRESFVKDLKDTESSFELTDDVLGAIMMSSYLNVPDKGGGEEDGS